jgi:hypothetical protein
MFSVLSILCGCVGYLFRTCVWGAENGSPSKEIIAEYEDRLRKMQLVPSISYGRRLLRKDSAPNRMFLTYLFGHQELAIQFLKYVGLIPSKVHC